MTGCPVCYRYVTADRSRIRYLVIEESLRTATNVTIIKQSLCEKHRHIGFSAKGHTVGEAGKSLGTTEAGLSGMSTRAPPLPTLSDFGVRHRSHHEYNVRRLKRLKLRRRRSKRFKT